MRVVHEYELEPSRQRQYEYELWQNTPVCWVCNRPVSRDMQAFMSWLICGVLELWWGHAWKGHSDNWALKNLSTGIEASATGESLNSGEPAVHPAARHKTQVRLEGCT